MSEYGEVYRQTTDDGKATVVVRKIWQARKGDSFHVSVLKGKGLARMEKKPGQLLFSDDKKSLTEAQKSAEKWLSSDKAKPLLAGVGKGKGSPKGRKAKTSPAYEDAKKRAAAQGRAKLEKKAKDNPVSKGTAGIPANELGVGDKIRVDGKIFRVAHVDNTNGGLVFTSTKGVEHSVSKSANVQPLPLTKREISQVGKMVEAERKRLTDLDKADIVAGLLHASPKGRKAKTSPASKGKSKATQAQLAALEKARAARASNKESGKPAKKTYVCKAKSPVKKGKLDAATRKKIPPVLFALPTTKELPLHDYGHTRSAMGRLNMMFRKGTVTEAQYREAWTNIKAACDCFGITMKKPPLVQIEPSAKKPSAKKPSAKKPSAKKPSAKKPSAKKPSAKKPSAKKPSAKKPSAKKPSAKKPSAKKPSAKKPSAKKPSAKKPSAKKPSAKKPSAKKPSAKKPSAKKPSAKKPSAKKPSAKKPSAKKPSAKKPSAKKPSIKEALEALKKAWRQYYLALLEQKRTTSQAKILRATNKISAAEERAMRAGASFKQINAVMSDALQKNTHSTRKKPSKSIRKAALKKSVRKRPGKTTRRNVTKKRTTRKARASRILIDQPNAMAILVSLEGRQWGKRQEKNRLDVRGFYSNLDAYKHLEEAGLSNAKDISLSDILAGSGEIDGEKGTIYSVDTTGEIALAYGTADAQKRERAKNLGMRVKHIERSNPMDDDGDEDLDIQLETNALISESRDGYAIAVENTYVDSADTLEAALDLLRRWMEENQFWPDVFYVNDRGNVDQLDVATGKTIRSW